MEKYLKIMDSCENVVLDGFNYIWSNPETGYREWKTHKYMKDVFQSLGYEITEIGNIPGFYADIDTGKEGPTLAIFAEMDGLIVPTHPESDKETGAVHSCGHCVQTAALLGVAAALKSPGILDGLSGKIRLIAVPAEEGIELEFRKSLIDKGIVNSKSGKIEFIHRGVLDNVDLSFMMHSTTTRKANCAYLNSGSNGLISKLFTFHGVSAHAAKADDGVNALYAANTALSAINALRETFKDGDHIRVHPVITKGGSSVNAIPDEVKLESYVRGANMDAIVDANRKVNRAIAASAAAIGAKVTITDMQGSWPRWNDRVMVETFKKAMSAVVDEVVVNLDDWNAGCSDMGDMASLMPTIHGYIGGAIGTDHGSDYYIADPKVTCMNAAKIELLATILFLRNGAEKAKEAVSKYTPYFKSKEEYIEYQRKIARTYEAVQYKENGDILLNIGK